MSAALRILLVDDDRDDFVLTRELLSDALGLPYELEWAGNYEAGRSALLEFRHDVYLLDYRLGARTGLDLLREAIALNCDAPLILLTGEGQRDIDMAAMEAGAADYLTKADLTGTALERSIRYSIERTRHRRILKQMNQLLETRVYERTCELEQANRELREADARKDEFLATLAHELRNPLAPITSALALLNVSDGNSDVALTARRTMERQVAQMVRLIDDLLEISRISRGKFELRRQVVELSDVLQQAIEASQPFLTVKHQTLLFQPTDRPIRLYADPARLAQIVGNLLNNASKFSDQGGTIELQIIDPVPCDSLQRDSVTGAVIAGDAIRAGKENSEGEHVQIVVKDNGIGIDGDQIDRIFEMFAQVDDSLERSQGGLGIGLTLVKSLVEFHGGTIQASSDGIGCGSQFTVTLPQARSSQDSPIEDSHGTRTSASVSLTPSGKRILVVDDNRDSASLLGMLLRASSNEVYLAFDGLEALDAARTHLPDVVLLDIGMPKQNGYETARQIRQQLPGKQILLVAMTGWGQQEDRRKSHEAGFDHHLVKPIDLVRLGELLCAPETATVVTAGKHEHN